MKERVTFVMCELDAYQHTTTGFTCLKAFQVSGLHPLGLDVLPSARVFAAAKMTPRRRSR
jgi:hypothetical protein